MPGDAPMPYSVSIPHDSLMAGRATVSVALPGSVLSNAHDGWLLQATEARLCQVEAIPLWNATPGEGKHRYQAKLT